jgi:hypothetical protein
VLGSSQEAHKKLTRSSQEAHKKLTRSSQEAHLYTSTYTLADQHPVLEFISLDSLCYLLDLGASASMSLVGSAVCAEGHKLADNGTCIPCDAGQYSAGGGDTCHDCGLGTFSAAGSSNCSLCDEGTTTAGTKTALVDGATKADVCTGTQALVLKDVRQGDCSLSQCLSAMLRAAAILSYSRSALPHPLRAHVTCQMHCGTENILVDILLKVVHCAFMLNAVVALLVCLCM